MWQSRSLHGFTVTKVVNPGFATFTNVFRQNLLHIYTHVNPCKSIISSSAANYNKPHI
jgi:hypothetical protein